MRPTISALRQWAPDAVLGDAVALRQSAQGLESAADRLVREFDGLAGSWSGDAASAARERVGAERRTLVALADGWTDAAAALESGGNALVSLRATVLGLVSAAEGESLHVDDCGGVRAELAWLDIQEWIRRMRAAKEYQASIDTALTAIDTADRDMALAVAKAAGGAADPASMLEGAPPIGEKPGQAGGEAFVIGDPTRPELTWDEDFVYGSAEPGFDDYKDAAEWKAKMAGARLLRGDLDDALDAYSHYWDNNGEPFRIDYDEACREDTAVKANVDSEVARATAGAERLIAAGNTSFRMSGDAAPAPNYPTTENWQKTVGGYQQWSSADVSVQGSTVTMTVTVHAEDYYNFNRGQADIASGAPDNANGRFTEVGWAKPFPTSGEVMRTVTWQVGNPGSATVVDTPKDAGR